MQLTPDRLCQLYRGHWHYLSRIEPEDEPERIDYIYIKKAKEGYAGLTCRSVKKWEDRDKEVWLSDHYPICAELEWINL